MPGSILVVCYDTSTGKCLGQKAGPAQIADGAIGSGLLASGIVGTIHLRDLNVTSAKLATAIIDLLGTVADGAITSAKIGAEAIGNTHLRSGDVQHGRLGGVGANDHHTKYTDGEAIVWAIALGG